MPKEEQDLLKIAKMHCFGEIDDQELGAILEVQNGHPILKDGSKNSLNATTITETLDAEGNVLIAGENYLFRNEKVKILREKFGCGNIMDTYYRVFYLNENLEEEFTVIEVTFKDHLLKKRGYHSKFVPIK